MKKWFLLTVIATCILSCERKTKKTDFTASPPKQIKVLAVTGPDSARRIEVVTRVEVDVAAPVVEDSTIVDATMKRQRIYFLPEMRQLVDSATRKPLLDSLGKPKTQLYWVESSSGVFWDFASPPYPDANVDSLLNPKAWKTADSLRIVAEKVKKQ